MPANPSHTILCPHCNVHAQVETTEQDCPHCGGTLAAGAPAGRTNALIHRSHPAGALLLGALMAACSAPGTNTAPDAEVNEASSGSESAVTPTEPAEEPTEESGTPTPEAAGEPDPSPPVAIYGMPPSMEDRVPDAPAYGGPPTQELPPAPMPVDEGSASEGSADPEAPAVNPAQRPTERAPVPVPVYGMPPGFR